MPGAFSIQELLSKARKRELTQLILDQSALALTIAMGGAIVLLLLGTELLNWWWLALLAAASLGAAIWRFGRTVPSVYTLAQRIDRRLKLADLISTAFYFGQHPDPQRKEICERQKEAADAVAGQVDLRAALPYRRSRFALPAAALFAAAFALFGLRYLVTGTMSLEPSLVRMAYDSFFSAKSNEAQNQAKGLRPKYVPSDSTDSNAKDEDRKEQDLNPADNPDANPDEANDSQAGRNGQQDKDSKKGNNDKGGDKGSNPDSSDKNQADNGNKNGDQKGDKPNDQDAKQANNNRSGSGMMDKLRDALNNMLSKMKPEGQQNANDSQPQDGKKGDSSDKSQKASQPGKDQQKADSQDSQADAQGDQNNAADADARDAKKSSDKNSADAKSGAGSQDGEKAIHEAAELKAMGQITEVLGKRSQNVTGEVMIEVGNGKQPLKTPFAQREANHVEAGSEIHRDEIPLAYQEFVQQYFEQVRKPVATPKPAPSN